MLTQVRRLFARISIIFALAGLALIVGPATAEIDPSMAIGVDMPNGDIARYDMPVPDPGLCRQACDQNGQCRGWAFVKPGVLGANAVCALKGTLGMAQADQNVISGFSGQGNFGMNQTSRVENYMGLGADLPGGDLGVGQPLQRADPALCAQMCEANGQCQSWTFKKPGVGQPAVCWLKGSIPNVVINNSTISARRVTPPPPVSGGVPGFGVWAYVIGVNAGNFSDPCQIQYVAVAIAGNRYDTDRNYRRVRERTTMKEASDDVTFFSLFMQDQPDNVVKFRPCSPNTQILPPRDGGTGTAVAGPSAVWAYTIGTATFADPCAIQYVNRAIAGNPFDSNPRYRRVAEGISSSEASRLVTRFSVFMEDNPDGVVKLISCADSKKAADTTNGNNGGNNDGGTADYAAWMTGEFNTNYGKMTLSAGGGSYEFDGGTLAVTRIDGATMEGRWTQKSQGGCGNNHGGRFSFTFTSGGFNGTWGHCDGPMNEGAWFGTRVQP